MVKKLFKQRAFTMIELMVVMAMVATLIAIAMPRYFDGLERAKETALRQNLKEMREAIGHYHEDKGQYPASLETLVSERYLRFIPEDPITESVESWQVIQLSQSQSGVYDVVSGSEATAKDGTAFSSW